MFRLSRIPESTDTGCSYCPRRARWRLERNEIHTQVCHGHAEQALEHELELVRLARRNGD